MRPEQNGGSAVKEGAPLGDGEFSVTAVADPLSW